MDRNSKCCIEMKDATTMIYDVNGDGEGEK
jgi:hypothetical protein